MSENKETIKEQLCRLVDEDKIYKEPYLGKRAFSIQCFQGYNIFTFIETEENILIGTSKVLLTAEKLR